MNFEIGISGYESPFNKVGIRGILYKVLIRILLWIVISAGTIGFFFHLMKATNFYLSSVPQSPNSKIYPDTAVFPVRGLHITSFVAGSSSLLTPLVELLVPCLGHYL